MESAINPLAPPWMWPSGDVAPPGFIDKYHEYGFDKSLTASEVSATGNLLQFDGDTCFLWRMSAVRLTAGSVFMRIRDHRGRFLMNDLVDAIIWAQAGSTGQPHMPMMLIPPGVQWNFEFRETSAVASRIFIALRGFKRFRVGGTA